MGKPTRVPTIRESATFAQVFRQAKAWHTPAFVCFYLSSTDCRVGFVASKKVGKAVERNRAKRRLRALFYSHYPEAPEGLFVLVAKRAVLTTDFDQLSEQFKKALKQLSTLEKRKKV